MLERYPSLQYIGPFAVFMVLLATADLVPLGQPAESIVRVTIISASIWFFSRRVLDLRAPHWPASIALGVAVFAMWIAPDALVPGWRSSPLFQNSITGQIKTSIDPAEFADPLTVILRVARAALLVPILEELFWRGWLPRWLVNPDWEQVPLGRYTTFAMVGTAVLFAAEHGPYWEVGLACGFIYNWWMWRTRSLGDLVLTHGVTNLCLSLYVLATKKWEYWM